MKLTKFRVQNYKRIEESDWIEVDSVTALVGGNETGKTSALQALWKLKPGRENIALDAQDEFPRRRYTDDYFRSGADKKWPVVTAVFEISLEISKGLAEINPPFKRFKEVICTTYYDHPVSITFVPERKEISLRSKDLKVLGESVKEHIATVNIEISEIEVSDAEDASEEQEEKAQEFRDAVDNVATQLLESNKSKNSSEEYDALLDWFKNQLQQNTNSDWQSKTMQKVFDEINTLLERRELAAQLEQAKQLVWSAIPTFVYFDEYNLLDSKILMPEAIQQIAAHSTDPKVRSQWALFELAGLDIDEIVRLAFSRNSPDQELSAEDRNILFQEVEKRGIHASAAARAITEKFQKWWRQQRHIINFRLDGETFQIEVEDENYRVPIKFEGRSKGFRWFFTFYLVFTAETEHKHKNAVLLLDEPGMHLYAPAQEELILLFDEMATDNQVLYTTHSGFMIDGRHLERVRFLEEMDDGLVRVSPDTGSVSGKTVMPVQAMIYYQTARLLFLARRVLIVEGPTDQLILHYLSDHLKQAGRTGLPEQVVVTFAGGTKSVPPLVAMMNSQEFLIPIMLDNDVAGRSVGKRLIDAGFTNLPNITVDYYGDVLGEKDPFDLESILPDDLYLRSVEESHKIKLPTLSPGKKETLSVAVRQHVINEGLEFDKGSAMQWLIDHWKTGGEIPSTVEDQFEKVFKAVHAAIDGMTEEKSADEKAVEPAAPASE